jgi:hypothetical protein
MDHIGCDERRFEEWKLGATKKKRPQQQQARNLPTRHAYDFRGGTDYPAIPSFCPALPLLPFFESWENKLNARRTLWNQD